MNRLYANVMKEETRLAIVDETGALQQIIYERPQLSNRVHHMYKGVVKNVLPGMSAAFLEKSSCRGSTARANCERCYAW